MSSLRPYETPMSLSPRRRDFSPSRPGTNGPSAKLEHVTERFAGLWTDLEQEKQNKRIAESTRFSLLQESLQRIEKSVERGGTWKTSLPGCTSSKDVKSYTYLREGG
ncbi:SF-assemblin [Tetrabaena socialis]|uniref:SF-assemblin n=1 Tax=Tetrabaena socialis TaxID=47790 RepID=A0A2J8A2W6_9CHLO|nr:SF-assemblin [Tetrabaena socialis]|eukprot:PNH06859.1 SF-assemblin [Tetrabaena socialis]